MSGPETPRAGFGRALAFAAGAGLVAVAAWLVLAPVLGVGGVRTLVWTAVGIGGVVLAAPSTARAFFAFLGILPLAAALAWVDPVAAGGSLGAALLLGLGRGALCSAGSGLRTLASEAAFAVAAVAFARLVGGPGPLGLGLEVWAFGLAQAPRALVVGTGSGPDRPGATDPFEVAEKRLHEVLREPG